MSNIPFIYFNDVNVSLSEDDCSIELKLHNQKTKPEEGDTVAVIHSPARMAYELARCIIECMEDLEKSRDS